MSDKVGYVKLVCDFLVLEEGERVVLKGNGVIDVISNNQRCIVVKNRGSFVLSLDSTVNGNIKISFKQGNPRTIGIFSKSSEKKLNLGVKIYNDPKTFEFLEYTDALIDSVYFEVPQDYDTIFLEKTLNNCIKLGVRNVFYVFQITEFQSLLKLSSIIEFLDASSKAIQKVFIILEDAIDIPGRKLNYLEDILLLFKDRRVSPVFSIPFGVVKTPKFNTREEFIENLENLKKVFIDAVSFMGEFPHLIGFDCGSVSTGLTNDDWITYIFGIATLVRCLGTSKSILYNIPGGHSPNPGGHSDNPGGHSDNEKKISNLTRKPYTPHTETSKDFSSSAGAFFFGGNLNRQEEQNFWNDDAADTPHLNLLVDKGISHLLFGPKNEQEDTECVPCKNNCYTVLDSNYILECIKTNFF
jgi:hypothetical protein